MGLGVESGFLRILRRNRLLRALSRKMRPSCAWVNWADFLPAAEKAREADVSLLVVL